MNKKNIIFVQLGSPESYQVADIRSYLKELLSNRHVVDLNPMFWKIILYLFILPFRPKKTAIKYKAVWREDGSPLKVYSAAIEEYLNSRSDSYNFKVCHVLSNPRFTKVLEELDNYQDIVVVPQFPQYCDSTTGIIESELSKIGRNIKLIKDFYDKDFYISSCVRAIENQLKDKTIDQLYLSFHGMPVEKLKRTHDPYYTQCKKTFELLLKGISCISSDKIKLTFHSKFGKGQWLAPDLYETVECDIKNGFKKIAVFCPGFTVDCLETLYDINIQLKESVSKSGGELIYIPCLNADADWLDSFSNFLYRHKF